MAWFYSDSGTTKGPLSDEEFQTVLRQGTITAKTLVWTEGMTEWLPYEQTVAKGPTSPSPTVKCSQCSRETSEQ